MSSKKKNTNTAKQVVEQKVEEPVTEEVVETPVVEETKEESMDITPEVNEEPTKEEEPVVEQKVEDPAVEEPKPVEEKVVEKTEKVAEKAKKVEVKKDTTPVAETRAIWTIDPNSPLMQKLRKVYTIKFATSYTMRRFNRARNMSLQSIIDTFCVNRNTYMAAVSQADLDEICDVVLNNNIFYGKTLLTDLAKQQFVTIFKRNTDWALTH